LGKLKSIYNISARKPQGRTLIEKPRYRWEVDIELVLRRKLSMRMWIDSAQVSVVGFCKQYNEPSGSIRGGEFLD
jgi:hypothetical protein